MSFEDVGYDEAMARAHALVPTLRERAAASEALRQMAKETEADFHRAGLFRFHQPRRWGGMELPFVALFDIPAEWRKRCADVTSASLPGGHFFVDRFPEETARILGDFLAGRG